MNIILNFISILGVVALCVRYYFEGKISVESAGFLMILCVILMALKSPAWNLIKALVAIISFALLLSTYSFNSSDMVSLVQPVLALILALFGIYIVIRAISKGPGRQDEDHFIYNRKTGKFRKK